MITVWNSVRNAYFQRVQIRLTLYFLFILIPLVGVSLFANFKSTEILEAQTAERTKNSLLSVLDNIDSTLQELENLSVLISTDYSIKPLLLEANEILLPSNLYDFYTIMNRLTNIVAINGALQEISLLHVPSRMLLSTEYGGKELDFEDNAWINSTIEADGKINVYIPKREEVTVFGANTISFMRLLDVLNQDDTTNVLVLSMSRDKLLEMIQSVQPTPNSSVYLYSSEGSLVAGTDQEFSNDEWSDLGGGEVGRMDGGKLVWRMQSDQSDWSLVMIQPEEELYEKSRQLSNFTNLIIVISIILALLISLVVYKGISAPLSVLLYGMKQMRMGKLHTRLSRKGRDEFGVLTDAFNQMIEEQQILIRDVYEHQLQLSKTELKFLHSQINPHFLYNTLDSIYWTAKNYDADEISEMVMNLSKFFRLSLGKGRETFTVEETIEHLMYYLKVQQFRFMGQFVVRFEIDENTKVILVLKLLLQPLVENAILHGLEKRDRGGELVISSTLTDQVLCLKVSDNGDGISTDRLAFIRSELEQLEHKERITSVPTMQAQESELFGLRNVVGRMKLYYGSESKLLIDSTEGEGTTVTLLLPIN